MARGRPKHVVPDYYDADDVRAIVIEIMGKDAVDCRAIAEFLCKENPRGVSTTHGFFLKNNAVTSNYIKNNLWAQKLREKYPIAFAENEQRFDSAVKRMKAVSELRLPDSFAGTLFKAIGGRHANQLEVAKRLEISPSSFRSYTSGSLVPGKKALEKLLHGLTREFPETVYLHPFLILYAEIDNITAHRIKSGNQVDMAMFRKIAGDLLKDVRESIGSQVEQVEEALTHARYPRVAQGKVAAIEEGDPTIKPSVFTSAMLAICQVFNLEKADPKRNQTLRTIAGIIARAAA